MNILYTAHATSTGGRSGHGATDDGALDVTLTTPKSMGGDGAQGTNPEQLFAVGYSACFLGALKAAARKESIKIPDDASISADVSIGPRDDGQGFGLAVQLTARVPGLERAKLEDLLQKAHIICPYSDATRGNIDVKLVATDA